MKESTEIVITGLGVVAPNGIGRDAFWQALDSGKSAIQEISSFNAQILAVRQAAEIKDFSPESYLEAKSLRNLDKSALYLAVAAKLLMSDAGIKIDSTNTDRTGVAIGTTFSHLKPIVDFDKEVFSEGLNFSNPALFPSTVINAASSYLSILFNIQGFNATISTGYTSSLTALKYACDALQSQKVDMVLSGGVDILIPSIFFAFLKLGYLAGLKGIILSCPYDKRRNGPVLGEGACVFCLEPKEKAEQRKAPILAKVRSIATYFDAFQMSKVHPQGEGIKKVVHDALEEAGLGTRDIDYVSTCANSSQDLDKAEVRALRGVFGRDLDRLPASSIKSMLGETFSASGSFQIASCLGAMQQGIIPPTINYQEKDPECNIDCVPNKAQTKKVNTALVVSSGPGGYSSACILEKYLN
jgi:3-oxoacyl-[acyl-carrier-protein] synthase II